MLVNTKLLLRTNACVLFENLIHLHHTLKSLKEMRGKVTNYIWSMAESSGEKGPLSERTHVTQWWQQALFLSFSLAQTHAQHCARLICVPSLSNRMRLFVRTLALPFLSPTFACQPASQSSCCYLFHSISYHMVMIKKQQTLQYDFFAFRSTIFSIMCVCDTLCAILCASNQLR